MHNEQWKVEYFDSVDTVIARLNLLSEYEAFRGQANKKYGLCPTLLRKDEKRKPKVDQPEACEVKLLSSFCQETRDYLYGPERDYANSSDLLHVLPLARHYGVPTRALDWTRNPLIAAYFACASDSDDEMKEDGAVWWFDARHHQFGGKFELSLKRYWDSHEFNYHISGEVDLSSLFEETGLPDRQFVTKIYYPPVIDRMKRQNAFLTVAGALEVNQQETIHLQSRGQCGQVVFPAAIKPDLLRELGFKGIHASALGDTIIDRIGASLRKKAESSDRPGV